MISRIARSLQYRARQYSYFNSYRDKLGLSRKDFNFLRNKSHTPGEINKVKFKNAYIDFTSPFWLLHSIEEIFIEEVYRFIPKKEDPVIVDCGANIGLSLLYFKQVCKGARITAFEADPFIFKILERNVASYSLTDINLVNRAIWVEDTQLEFNSEGALGGRLISGNTGSAQKVLVNTTRLRDLLDSSIDFLKIDIEGAEYEVIKDCRDKLSNVDKLFLEYHVMANEQQYLGEILEWLRDAGFRYYIREAWKNQDYPFIQNASAGYEMQLNIFCYRR